MRSEVDHVLLTRFNLPSKGAESLIRAKEGWLRERVGLFERYCLPSVRRQTITDFKWIIYFDPQSPEWLIDRISQWSVDGLFTPIFREQVPREELLADIRAVSGARHQQLITTNLDNDDGLAEDFIERLQQTAVHTPRTALYLTRGLIKHDGRLYRRIDRNNAFCSVREDWSEVVTCWVDWHNLLGEQMPVVEIDGDAAWLQVIHELNVSNRVRGRRVSPAYHRPSFGAMLADVGEPTKAEIAAETLWHVPQRVVKEAGRATIKNVAVRVGGKDGLDNLKRRLQQAKR